MPAALEHLEHFDAGFRFCFGNATGGAETAIHIDHGRAPELTGLVGFGVAFFSPLLRT
jgi:hypothetical protein